MHFAFVVVAAAVVVVLVVVFITRLLLPLGLGQQFISTSYSKQEQQEQQAGGNSGRRQLVKADFKRRARKYAMEIFTTDTDAISIRRLLLLLGPI